MAITLGIRSIATALSSSQTQWITSSVPDWRRSWISRPLKGAMLRCPTLVASRRRRRSVPHWLRTLCCSLNTVSVMRTTGQRNSRKPSTCCLGSFFRHAQQTATPFTTTTQPYSYLHKTYIHSQGGLHTQVHR
ncbi:hypothetical protein J4Q44_G00012540 [Coregonus suidteri]|uniref:Uncharacterized protein n=1 Tax=Coregonus suidteri TaxID=861788 RepID=A0AAN8ML73_9TELE